MVKYYQDRGLCIFKQSISVPGISQILGFRSITNKEDQFFLFNKKNKDMADLFMKNNTGGPSLIFNRFSEAGT